MHGYEYPVPTDDQPVASAFFGEGRWLTDFITPDALEVEKLHEKLISGLYSIEERLIAMHQWVSQQVKYVEFVRGQLWVNGKVSNQDDFWQMPALAIRTRVGNCANKAFLLTSLIRREFPPDLVHCVLGNLHNGKPGGHAWVEIFYDNQQVIMESTRPDAKPMVRAETASRYEAVHYFNDQEVKTIFGKTTLIPFSACYSEWLRDYIDWAYVEGEK